MSHIYKVTTAGWRLTDAPLLATDKGGTRQLNAGLGLDLHPCKLYVYNVSVSPGLLAYLATRPRATCYVKHTATLRQFALYYYLTDNVYTYFKFYVLPLYYSYSRYFISKKDVPLPTVYFALSLCLSLVMMIKVETILLLN